MHVFWKEKRSDAPDVADAAMFVLLGHHWPRSDVAVTILPELSTIMKVVYYKKLSILKYSTQFKICIAK